MTASRGVDSLPDHKKKWAHEHAPCGSLIEAVHALKPTALIGVSAIRGAFDKDVLQAMAKYHKVRVLDSFFFLLSFVLQETFLLCLFGFGLCASRCLVLEALGECAFFSGNIHAQRGSKVCPVAGRSTTTCFKARPSFTTNCEFSRVFGFWGVSLGTSDNAEFLDLGHL